MSTFYVLPPRPVLDDAVSGLLARLLPGLPVPADAWDRLADRLLADALPSDVYLVPRDDLPDGVPVEAALADGFGAEPGDRIVSVASGQLPAYRH